MSIAVARQSNTRTSVISVPTFLRISCAVCWSTRHVEHVNNITDVGYLTSDADTGEDKMNSALSGWASPPGISPTNTPKPSRQILLHSISRCLRWCKATDHIPEQIQFIEELEAKGFTYATNDGIYFDSQKLDNHGHLARLDIDGLISTSRAWCSPFCDGLCLVETHQRARRGRWSGRAPGSRFLVGISSARQCQRSTWVIISISTVAGGSYSHSSH